MHNLGRKVIFSRKNQAFSLVEIGIFILIAAAIIYAIVKYLTKYAEESKATAEATSIIDMMNKVKKIGAQGGRLHTNADYIKANVLPSHWKISGNSIKNGFGGDVSFTGINYAMTGNQEVKLSNIPSAACLQIIVILARSPNTNGIWNGDWTMPFGGVLNHNYARTLCYNNRILVPHLSINYDIW